MKTPTFGDWRAESLDDLNIWILDAEGNYLAQIVTSDEEGRFLRSTRRREAAANLMAAAPKLLKALKKLRAYPHAWLEADEAIAEAGGGP